MHEGTSRVAPKIGTWAAQHQQRNQSWSVVSRATKELPINASDKMSPPFFWGGGGVITCNLYM